MKYKNKITGAIGTFGGTPNLDEWEKASEEDVLNLEILKAKQKKALEIKNWKTKNIGAMLQVRGNYYVKPSPTENIFLASKTMQDGATKKWRAMDESGEKLFSLDEDGNKIEPLFLELTKVELQSASNHYEERKTNTYFLHDTALFMVENKMSTLEEVEAFDMAEWVKIHNK